MKKTLFYIVCLSVFIFTSCASKESKAEKLIKEELSKTLLDFESYEPIETKVTEAKQTMYNDTACRRLAICFASTVKIAGEYQDKADEAEEHMDIYEPSYYSDSYVRKKYYEYKEERDDNLSKGKFTINLALTFAKDLKEKIAELDTSKVIGWNVTHRFRCKTRGGNSTIADYKYLIDSDFDNIIFCIDDEDDDEKMIIEALEYARDNEINEID